MKTTPFQLLLLLSIVFMLCAAVFITASLYGMPWLGIEGVQSYEIRRAIQATESAAERQSYSYSRWIIERRLELRLQAESESFINELRAASEDKNSRLAGAAASRSLTRLSKAHYPAYSELYVWNPATARQMAASNESTDAKAGEARHTDTKTTIDETIDLVRNGENTALRIARQIKRIDAHGTPDGQTVGTLIAHLNLLYPLREAQQSVEQALGIATSIILIDRRQRVLAVMSRTPNETGFNDIAAMAQAGTEGVHLLRGRDGMMSIAAFKHLHLGADESLTLAAINDTSEVREAVYLAFLRVSALGGLGFLLFLATAVYATRRIASAQMQMLASEERLRMILDHTPAVAVQQFDAEGRVLYWNDASETLYGFSAQETLGKTLDQLFWTPEQTAEWLQSLHESARSGKPIGPLEAPLTHRSGEQRYIMYSSFAILEAGDRHRYICMDVDITERKRAEESLRASETRLLSMFHDSPGAQALVDATTGHFVDVNRAWSTLTQFSREEALGRTSAELGLRSQEKREAGLALLKREGHLDNLEDRLRRRDGMERICLRSARHLGFGERQLQIWWLVDVTESRQAEAVVRASQERFEALFKESPTPTRIFAYKNRRTLDCNDAICTLYGYSREELLGRTLDELNIQADDAARRSRLRALGAGERVNGAEIEINTRSGEKRTALIYMLPLDWHGEKACISQLVDITDRKRASEALRESEARLLSMFHDSPGAQSMLEFATGKFVDVNQAWTVLTQLSRDEVLGKTSAELHLRDDTEGAKIRALIAQDGSISNIPLGLCRRDGVVLSCLASGRLIEIKGVKFMLMWMIDVTEQRRAQEQIQQINASLEVTVARRTTELQRANTEIQGALNNLRSTQNLLVQSEKLAALGRLVAGISHELNTPIGNGLLSATTLAERTEAFAQKVSGSLRRSTLEKYVADAREGTAILLKNLERANNLIGSFKQVAADQSSSQRRRFHLWEVIEDVLLAHQPMLKKTPITVSKEVPPDICLDSYPGPLGQVIGNLLTNTLVHAFEGRPLGHVRIGARLIDAHAEISIKDDGCGIPESNLKRIFDPFFTTRLGRGGTGLGLSICHSIVTQTLGGTLQARSRLGEGSEFTLHIPLNAPEKPE